MADAAAPPVCHPLGYASLSRAAWLVGFVPALAACSSEPVPAASTDASLEGAAKPDACVPNCHWDCMGTGYRCMDGDVFSLARGAMKCCHPGDPPFTKHGEWCEGPTVHQCQTGCRQQPQDERYAACLDYLASIHWLAPDTKGLIRLLCHEGEPKHVLDPCASDEDCRPVETSVPGALRCDTATHRCIEYPRPAEPVDYGSHCGLALSGSGWVGSDFAKPGDTCKLCHVALDSASNCLAQACTMECLLDEDCPAGSVCVCGDGTQIQSPQHYCVKGTARTFPERTAWLSCASTDAGSTDAASD